ncbi:STAS domain-containing protein [Streptomyces sp. AM 2-1-1]|uniref:STAS domain-containing protein n=1 Tax=Streptomyces sp. AM 2-1-1 TaxID=3028709 RepID=UPI0023B94D2F|nr:STAS domain-containing protein [Streptomyces sp. AM 2-1-1]WEH38104.1 STAS domain-containing protein [Streptomyces sp. AM 2-1-1]
MTHMTVREPYESAAPIPVLTWSGDLDLDSLPLLEDQVAAALARHDTLILETSGITFADSSFLRLLLTLHDQSDLRIAAPSPTVRRLLRIVGADTFLHLYPTLDAAHQPRTGHPA